MHVWPRDAWLRSPCRGEHRPRRRPEWWEQCCRLRMQSARGQRGLPPPPTCIRQRGAKRCGAEQASKPGAKASLRTVTLSKVLSLVQHLVYENKSRHQGRRGDQKKESHPSHYFNELHQSEIGHASKLYTILKTVHCAGGDTSLPPF